MRILGEMEHFKNSQMDPAEVLAIEGKQYVGEKLKTLVPRIVGRKTPGPAPTPKPWDESRFPGKLRSQLR